MSVGLSRFPDRSARPVAIARQRRLAQRRASLVHIALAGLAASLFGVALVLGDYPLAPAQLIASLASPLTGVVQPGVDFIVWGVRLPRATMGVMTGIAFGVSGALFQSLLRNPIASPDIIGISTGSSAAAVVAIALFGLSGAPVTLAALAGGLGCAGLLYALAWRDGISVYRVVLVGLGLAALMTALVSYAFTRARVTEVQEALLWLTGSLASASPAALPPLAIALLVCLPLAFALQRPLKGLQLGDDLARGLGLRPLLVFPALLAVAAALTAFPVAAVGPVAFVAFLAGPIGRALRGDGQPALLAGGLSGVAIMLAGDLLAQHAIPGVQLPVGVVTGGFGAIVLVALLAASGRKGRLQ